MASLAIEPGAGLHQEPLADYVLIRTADIDAGDRLRAVDRVWGLALGGLMAKDGQQTPIQVCRLPGSDHWTLVVGAHRHFGAQALELEFMKAEIVSADRDGRRLREIVENLHRRDLDPLDRAAFLAELVALKRARAGLAAANDRAGKVRHDLRAVSSETQEVMETISMTYGWTEEIGAQLGFTGRTVRNDLLIYRRLPPSLVARLRDGRHPILSNASQLRALAKLEPAEQGRVTDTLLGATLNGRTITSVAQAQAIGGGAKPLADPEAKRLSAFIGAFHRMGLAEKKAAVAALLPLVPAGCLPEPKAAVPSSPLAGEPVAGDLLTAGIDAIARGLADKLEPDFIVGELTRRHGARARFNNGTYELRLGGAVGTCTSGGLPMLQSWVRAAQKKREARA